MLRKILRKLGLASSRVQAPSSEADDDQAYTEAVMDNAIRSGDETLVKLAEATASTQRANETLSREIDRITSAQKVEPMTGLIADLHYMGRRNGNA